MTCTHATCQTAIVVYEEWQAARFLALLAFWRGYYRAALAKDAGEGGASEA